MNEGANVGINVIYSGTVAAAIEAAFLGCPSIAVSLHLKNGVPVDFAGAAKLARETIDRVMQLGLQPGQIVSINIPALLPNEKPAGTKVVRQCTRPWVDTYEERLTPRGRILLEQQRCSNSAPPTPNRRGRGAGRIRCDNAFAV